MSDGTVGSPGSPLVGAGARPVLSSEIAGYREHNRPYGSSAPAPATRSDNAPVPEPRGAPSSSSPSSHLMLAAEEACHVPYPVWDGGLGSALVDAIHALQHTRPRTQTYAESFVPNPRLTFLLENPRLECVICYEPTEMTDSLEDSTPSIRFCGHVACHKCLRQCLATNGSCPCCRKRFTHPNCGHVVEPREVTKQNVISIPRTKAAGGKVADNCRRCHRDAAREKAHKTLETLVKRYVRVRDAADDDGGDDDTRVAPDELAKAQARLERFKMDFEYNSVMRDSAW